MHELIAFAIVAGIITITPGLDTFMVLRNSVRYGFRAGFLASIGVNVGLLTWALASAGGVAAIVVASQEAFNALRIAGALYLTYLGIKSIWHSLRGRTGVESTIEMASMSGWSAFRTGLINNLLNPKIGVFYLTIFPQFIPDEGSAFGWGATMAMIHVIEGMAWLLAVALFATSIRPLLSRPVVTRIVDLVTGVVFFGFGTRIAQESRTG